MKPIPFRRRLKQLSKTIQRCNGDYHKTIEIRETFMEQFGYRIGSIGTIKHLLNLKYSGSAMFRVGKAAVRMGCYIEPFSIPRDGEIHLVPFHKFKKEVLMFSREDTVHITVQRDGTEKILYRSTGSYNHVEN